MNPALRQKNKINVLIFCDLNHPEGSWSFKVKSANWKPEKSVSDLISVGVNIVFVYIPPYTKSERGVGNSARTGRTAAKLVDATGSKWASRDCLPQTKIESPSYRLLVFHSSNAENLSHFRLKNSVTVLTIILGDSLKRQDEFNMTEIHSFKPKFLTFAFALNMKYVT